MARRRTQLRPRFESLELRLNLGTGDAFATDGSQDWSDDVIDGVTPLPPPPLYSYVVKPAPTPAVTPQAPTIVAIKPTVTVTIKPVVIVAKPTVTPVVIGPHVGLAKLAVTTAASH